MSKEIDWSRAPQWADRVLAMGMAGAWAWANEHQYQYIGKINKEIFLYEEENTWNLSDGELVEMRHSVETWTGTSLPPVGTVCEGYAQGLDLTYTWRKCTVLHANKEECAVMLDDSVLRWCDQFRPIRTETQIEAEERADAVKEMIKIAFEKSIDSYGELHVHTMAEILYDHGYRKTEAGK